MAPLLTFRRATAADVPAVVSLVESAYRGVSSELGWTSESHLLGGQRTDPAMVEETIARPGSLILLAEEDGVLRVSCEIVAPSAGGDVGYFGMFAVEPTLQGGGYGRLVLAEAERIARDDLGASALEMTVIRQREALIAWYERRGYARTGETRPFPYGDERYGLPKVDDLEMVVLAKTL